MAGASDAAPTSTTRAAIAPGVAALADTPASVGAQLKHTAPARHTGLLMRTLRIAASRNPLAPVAERTRAALGTLAEWLDNAELRKVVASAALATAAMGMGAAGAAEAPHSAGPTASFGSAFPEGSYAAERLYQQAMLEKLAALSHVDPTITGEVHPAAIKTEMTKQAEWVPKLANLLASKQALPPALLSDVGQLLDKIASTKVGTNDVTKAFDFAPLRTQLIGGARLEALLTASATEGPDRVQKMLADYAVLSQGAQRALLTMPDFAMQSPVALTYPSSVGTLGVPAGSTIVHKGGQFTVEGQGLTWRGADGWDVVAGRGTFALGGSVEGFASDLIDVNGPLGSARLAGGTLGFGTDAAGQRTGLMRADAIELDVARGAGRLTNAEVVFANNGDTSVTAHAIEARDAAGRSATLDGAAVGQTRAGITARADTAAVVSDAATLRAAQLDLIVGPAGLVMKAGALELDARGATLRMTDATITSAQVAGGEVAGGQRITLAGSALDYSRGATSLSSTGNAVTELKIDAQGRLTGLDIRGDAVRIGSKGGTLDVVQGGTAVGLDGAGALSRVALHGQQVRYSGKGLSMSGTDLVVDYDKESPTRLSGNVTHVELARGTGRLGLDGGSVTASVLPDGNEVVNLSAQRIAYAGRASGDDPLDVVFGRSSAVISARADGGQDVNVTSRDGAATVDGRVISLAGGQQFKLATSADQTVTSFSGTIENVGFEQHGGALKLMGQGVTTSFQDGRLSVDLARVQGADSKRGITASAAGISGLLEQGRVGLRIEGAELSRGSDRAGVRDVTLQLAAGKAHGADAQLLDVGIGGADGHVKGIDYTLTSGAVPVRLGLTATPEGLAREVSLVIPNGAALKLARNDLKLDLGPQALRIAAGADGVFHVRADGIDVRAMKGATAVSIKGGSADVTLDPRRGALLLNDITGTAIHADTPSGSVDLEIAHLRGFIASMTKLSGPVTGVQMELTPTSDASRMTATLRANVGGIAVRVDVDDAHALRGLVEAKTNTVNVYLGDPSGRGKVHASVGPIDLSGAYIAGTFTYTPFDMKAMLHSVSQAASSNQGIEVLPGLKLDPAGKIHVGTSGPGLNAALVLLSPSGTSAGGESTAMKAGGVVVDVSYETKRTTTVGAFAGLVPAATAQMTFQGGTAKLFKVPVKGVSAPATFMAGVRTNMPTAGGGRAGFTLGGFANAGGFVDQSFIKEPEKGGVFVGVEHAKRDVAFAAQAVVTNTKKVGFQATLTIALGR